MSLSVATSAPSVVSPVSTENVAILFIDIVGSTELSERITGMAGRDYVVGAMA